jgi:hypothetical protein
MSPFENGGVPRLRWSTVKRIRFLTAGVSPWAWQVICGNADYREAVHPLKEEKSMNGLRVIVMAIGILWLPTVALAANPAKTYTGTTIENVDTSKQTVSIKTKTGESWTLKVTDPEMLKKYNLKKGDQVSIEVDTNNNITKIAKAGESGQSDPGQAPNQ